MVVFRNSAMPKRIAAGHQTRLLADSRRWENLRYRPSHPYRRPGAGTAATAVAAAVGAHVDDDRQGQHRLSSDGLFLVDHVGRRGGFMSG